MAFNSSGTSNGTISGNADALKGESASNITISGSLPITQNTASGPTQGPGVPNKKHKHDDEEQGKLFVGGLSWDTAQDSLLQYFSRFGEVIDCVVMKNAETGRSRGFGFVTFSDPLNVDAVIASCPHTLDGRTIDPKSCNPRSMQKPKRSNYLPKIFLGGLPSSITETELRSFFSQFGEVCEVVIMYDQEKKKSRGFGFLSFADELACSKAVSHHFVNIQNKQVEVKRAEPRTIQGGNSIQGKDVPSNMPTSQWPSMQNGHPRHLIQQNYGVPNVPPPHTLRSHPSVSLPPPHSTMLPGWGVPSPTVPPPALQHTSLPNNPVMSPQTPPHPPPALFHTQYTSPSTTPIASPLTHNWLQPPPPASNAIRVTTTTPQPLVPPNNWTPMQPSVPSNVVPTFASPLPVPSPVHSTAQPTPFPGAATVYPPPSTPQPGFWGMVPVPVPTPPPSSQAMSVDPYLSHHPATSTNTQQPSKVAYNSQYGGIAVSAASVLPAPVQSPVSYPVYQQSHVAQIPPGVSMASPSPGKPFINASGVDYYNNAGTMNHSPAPPHPGTTGHNNIGGILVASPIPAAHFSQPPINAASGVQATVQSASDLNATINASLGPQRGIIYNQPSQMQGYHPYRRM